ncbi:MAG: hypothetical protein KGH58_03395 [Candidatus Micrarchaeota archaeon]|nr:hypothetical protein [Candidatus Micrarchaeota archaeon]
MTRGFAKARGGAVEMQPLALIHERITKIADEGRYEVEQIVESRGRSYGATGPGRIGGQDARVSKPGSLNLELHKIIEFAEGFIGEAATKLPSVSFEDLRKVDTRLAVRRALGLFRHTERDILIDSGARKADQALAFPHEYAHFYINASHVYSDQDSLSPVRAGGQKLSLFGQESRQLATTYTHIGMNEAAAMLFEAAYTVRDDRLVLPYIITKRVGDASVMPLCVILADLLRRDLRAGVGTILLEPIVTNLMRLADETGGFGAEYRKRARSRKVSSQVRRDAMGKLDDAPYVIGAAAIISIMGAGNDSKAAFKSLVEMIRQGPEYSEAELYGYAKRAFGDVSREVRSRKRLHLRGGEDQNTR